MDVKKGYYLNSDLPYQLFLRDRGERYFVDKSSMIADVVCRLQKGNGLPDPDDQTLSRYIAITRPRRFGKTTMTNMLTAYFEKYVDSHLLFDNLDVSQFPWYHEHLNKHNVIHITLSEAPNKTVTYDSYINRVERLLLRDLMLNYPDAGITDEDALWDALSFVNLVYHETFVFIIDEWDYIFHQPFVTSENASHFVRYLSNLLKDKAYVELAYMTGILPISSYSSGTDLNMFYEYGMATKFLFSDCFGFTEDEVDDLYMRYLEKTPYPIITRRDLHHWYDGYKTASGKRIYNPRSVVGALQDNQLCSYWTSSGPYDDVVHYIKANVDAIKDDIAQLVAGNPVPANIQEYAAAAMDLKTKDQIFSAMVVYGFLNYDCGCVSIPNKELMDKFKEVVEQDPSMGNVYLLANISGRMLEATKQGDTKTMVELLEYAHNTESPTMAYNDHNELASIIRWVYLKAMDYYDIHRGDRTGTGFADFIFYPFKKDDDGIIIELKVDGTPEGAIKQIKDRQYILRFEGKLGQKPEYTGRVLAVGIAYSKTDLNKRHACKVEVLREKL